jgi:hypothetical protein
VCTASTRTAIAVLKYLRTSAAPPSPVSLVQVLPAKVIVVALKDRKACNTDTLIPSHAKRLLLQRTKISEKDDGFDEEETRLGTKPYSNGVSASAPPPWQTCRGQQPAARGSGGSMRTDREQRTRPEADKRQPAGTASSNRSPNQESRGNDNGAHRITLGAGIALLKGDRIQGLQREPNPRQRSPHEAPGGGGTLMGIAQSGRGHSPCGGTEKGTAEVTRGASRPASTSRQPGVQAGPRPAKHTQALGA